MAWEEIEKKTVGKMSMPERWATHPCVVVRKSGVVFNVLFQETFGINRGDSVRVFIDSENGKIGIKRVPDDSELIGYKVTSNGPNGKPSDTSKITCATLLKKIESFIGVVAKARLNPEERVIEIDLNGKPAE